MNRQKRQEQILNTALKIFARDGYEDTTISRLVTEARVSRGTFYLYFQSKKDVFDCLIDNYLDKILNAFNTATCHNLIKEGRLVEPFCLELSNELANCFIQYHQLTRIIMLDAKSLHRSHRNKINAYWNQFHRQFEKNLVKGIQASLIYRADTEIITCCFMGAIKELSLRSKRHDVYQLQEKINALIHFTFKSLLPIQKVLDNITASPSQEENLYIEDLPKEEYH